MSTVKSVSYKTPSVNSVLSNLQTVDTTAEGISNAQKAFERAEWCKAAISAGKLPELLIVFSKTIEALPVGNTTRATFNARTGEHGTKKVNFRDVAKVSISKAFKVASDKFPEYKGKIISWKLSTPAIIDADVKAPETLADKLVKLLGDTVDEKGISAILATIDKEQARNRTAVAAMAKKSAVDATRKLIASDYQLLLDRGCTIEQAINKVAILHDIDANKARKALNI